MTPHLTKNPAGQQPIRPIPQPVRSEAEVRAWVNILLRAESMNHPDAQEARARLTQMALYGGPYVIATEIRGILERTPAADNGRVTYSKERGYALAAEFFVQHLLQEILSIERQARPIGQAIFKCYCDEIMDCLFAAKNARKGIEIAVEIIDGLLLKAVDSFTHKNTYLHLAQLLMKSLMEFSNQKLEKDAVELHRTARLQKQGDTPPPKPKSLYSMIDSEIIRYLIDFQRKLTQLERALSQYDVRPTLSGKALSEEHDPTSTANQVFYLRGLARIADRIGCVGLSALLKELIGTALNRRHPGKGARFLYAAAKDHEVQADIERDLLLDQLSLTRYARAYALYSRTGGQAKAREVELKIQNSPGPGSGHPARHETLAG